MAKFTKDTQCPRTWTDTKLGLKFITQPYITGLYIAGNKGSTNIIQTGCGYKKLASFLEKLQKSETITNIVLAKLGDYMEESDFKYLNL